MPRPEWRSVAILSLLLLGWVCPSAFPPHGVVFGGSGPPEPDLYWINIYVGAGGWFSKAIVVEKTWEWTHGHSWPVGPWIGGYLVSLFVPVSAGLIIFSRISRAFIGPAWAWISIWLTVTWLELFSNLAQYGWRTWVLLLVFAAYWILLWSLWFWSAKLGWAERISLLACYSLLFYPVWLLALIVTQGLYPFIGWGFTAAGCVLLVLQPAPTHSAADLHAEDKPQVRGFRLMAANPNVDLDFYDGSLSVAIHSKNSSYIKKVLREKIRRASILVCLIGNGTAWRDWVDWEIETAYAMGKGVCGARLKGSYGRRPTEIVTRNAPMASWNMQEIVAAIECAAARRG